MRAPSRVGHLIRLARRGLLPIASAVVLTSLVAFGSGGQDPAESDLDMLTEKALAGSGSEYLETRNRILSKGEEAKKYLSGRFERAKTDSERVVLRALLNRLDNPDYYKSLDSELDNAGKDRSRRGSADKLEGLLLKNHPDAEGQRACILEMLTKQLLPWGYSLNSQGFRRLFVESLYRFVFENGTKAEGTPMQKACHAFGADILLKDENVDRLRMAIGHFGLQNSPEARQIVMKILIEDKREIARVIAVRVAGARVERFTLDTKKEKLELLHTLTDRMAKDHSIRVRHACAADITAIASPEALEDEKGRDDLRSLSSTLSLDVVSEVVAAIRSRMMEESSGVVLTQLYEALFSCIWPEEMRRHRGTALYTASALGQLRQDEGDTQAGSISDEDERNLLQALDADKESVGWRQSGVIESFRTILFVGSSNDAGKKQRLLSKLCDRLGKETDVTARLMILEGLRVFAGDKARSPKFETFRTLGRQTRADLRKLCADAIRVRASAEIGKAEREMLDALAKLYAE
jgi:hypothetical protein